MDGNQQGTAKRPHDILGLNLLPDYQETEARSKRLKNANIIRYLKLFFSGLYRN